MNLGVSDESDKRAKNLKKDNNLDKNAENSKIFGMRHIKIIDTMIKILRKNEGERSPLDEI